VTDADSADGRRPDTPAPSLATTSWLSRTLGAPGVGSSSRSGCRCRTRRPICLGSVLAGGRLGCAACRNPISCVGCSPQAAWSTRFRSTANPARPCIWRLSSLNR
jgi:hypothetical protein